MGRYDREKEFHNTVFESERRASLGRYYAITDTSHGYYHKQIRLTASGGRVLEYGCGEGSQAFDLAEIGYCVDAIDISDVAIRKASQRATERRVESRTAFRVMNAEMLEFDDAQFDTVCGSGILHHLDLERALREILRVLKPGGMACFLEPLAHNPLINLYRRLTPALRSDDEHPLTRKDLRLIRQHFPRAEFRFFHFFELLALPLSTTKAFPGILRIVRSLDDKVLNRNGVLDAYSWIVVIVVRKEDRE